MRSGLARMHPLIEKFCGHWSLDVPSIGVDESIELASVDGDLLLAEMQRSMMSGF